MNTQQLINILTVLSLTATNNSGLELSNKRRQKVDGLFLGDRRTDISGRGLAFAHLRSRFVDAQNIVDTIVSGVVLRVK